MVSEISLFVILLESCTVIQKARPNPKFNLFLVCLITLPRYDAKSDRTCSRLWQFFCDAKKHFFFGSMLLNLFFRINCSKLATCFKFRVQFWFHFWYLSAKRPLSSAMLPRRSRRKFAPSSSIKSKCLQHNAGVMVIVNCFCNVLCSVC